MRVHGKQFAKIQLAVNTRSVSAVKRHAGKIKENGQYDQKDYPAKDVVETMKSDEKSNRWSVDEHILLIKGLKEHGKKWTEISETLTNRKKISVRNYAMRMKKVLQAKTELEKEE